MESEILDATAGADRDFADWHRLTRGWFSFIAYGFQFLGCRGKEAKWAKLGGQGGQVQKVEKHLDGSGFGSSVPRGPSGFEGPYGASLKELEVRRLFGRGRR